MARTQKRKKEELESTKATSEAEPATSTQASEEGPNHVDEVIPAKRRKISSATAVLPTIPRRHQTAGQVYVCGEGDSGQLGLGNLIPDNDEDEDLDDPSEVKLPRHSPVDQQGSGVVQVAAGGMHSVALTEDGRVFTTGVNDEAALGRCTDSAIWESERQSGAQAGDAYKWGTVAIPQDLGIIVEISAGDSHTVALTEFGAVWAWGLFRGNSGPYGFGPGKPHALRPTLVYQPANAAEQVTAISSGADHVLGVRNDGSVISWGYGEQGQLGRLGSRLRNPEKTMLEPAAVPLYRIKGFRKRFRAVSVAAGSFGSFVIAQDGAVVAFGVNASGQLGLDIQGNTVDSNIIHRPAKVDALANYQGLAAISAGKSHTLALTSAGDVLSFGLQTYGRLGRADADTSSDGSLAPGRVIVPAEDAVSSIIAGHDTSAVINSQNALFTWGMGTNYQLCRKSDNDVPAPFQVKYERFEPPVSGVLDIAFGGQHTLLIANPLQ